ncbi:[FeFe] hydrogenase H-cluster radical SAM maturase HydE [Clostridia bacterium]|nr:[FeFe] hydrogenase H-cluster radical SAM maturase HydE [Clostridia bacterium]
MTTPMTDSVLLHFIQTTDPDEIADLFQAARDLRELHYGKDVYVRGLIEFTSYCRNDCYYCGLRCSNHSAERYRLSVEEILNCCHHGERLGFHTFVLQGGEDPYFTDTILTEIITEIRRQFPNHAITLSIGERSFDSYARFFAAGADRYLLRHETANETHYGQLHPNNMSLKARKKCLMDLKEIGYQVGAGLMVGSPFQTAEHLLEDLHFLQELQPHMVGIGPFIPHVQTPFSTFGNGDLDLTFRMIALTRLLLPNALLPATTAVGTLSPKGREAALLAGANVVMPNLSPLGVRKKYALYDNKICTGDETAECLKCLQGRIERTGYSMNMGRGDYIHLPF